MKRVTTAGRKGKRVTARPMAATCLPSGTATWDPPRPNTMQICLLITDDRGELKAYNLTPAGGPTEAYRAAWRLHNERTDRTYTLIDTYTHGVTCDCPGWAKTRPTNADGTSRQGCKHARALRAARRTLMGGPPPRPHPDDKDDPRAHG